MKRILEIDGVRVEIRVLHVLYNIYIAVFSKACLRARRSAHRSEAGGKRPRRSAVSRVARLALVRREKALQGVARQREALQGAPYLETSEHEEIFRSANPLRGRRRREEDGPLFFYRFIVMKRRRFD
ncbi:unnamed protein product [Prunus armeniaca]